MGVRDIGVAAGLLAVDLTADLSARLFPFRPAQPPHPDRGTLSVLIPERGTPDLLRLCLESTVTATQALGVPVQVVVVVNGHASAAYEPLARRFPAFEWLHWHAPLGFNGAVEAGLRAVTGDWVYLLNSDMVIAADALSTLLPYRDARTFAIASQIHFADAERRREETGWTDYVVHDGVTHHLDRVPEDDERARGHLYAGGGASLFRTEALRRFVPTTRSYDPFYFEDADWGLQACRAGLHVKFCPRSRVVHRHRATISRYYEASEIERVIRRNIVLFEARHGLGGRRSLLRNVPEATRNELTRPTTLAGILRERWHTRRALRAGMAPSRTCLTVFNAPLHARRQTHLLAMEGLLPREPDPTLARALASHARAACNRVLVTQDAGVLDAALPWTQTFHAIHCVPASSSRPRAGRREFLASVAWWSHVYDARPSSIMRTSETSRRADPSWPGRATRPAAGR